MNYILKSILFIISILWCCTSFSQSDSSIIFHETSFDFGDIVQGDTVSHVFKFTNFTNNDLEIIDVITQCGCTSSSAEDSGLIKPGENGQVKILFDSDEKEGRERKTIKVKFSDFSSSKLVIYANVLSE